MNAQIAIQKALDRETQKLIRRHNRAAAAHSDNRRRYEMRSGEIGLRASPGFPAHWSAHPHFDPYYVRHRIECFSHAIAKKIRHLNYAPNPSLLARIPNAGTGTREVSIFTVPDAAVCYWLGRRLIQRNLHRFSPYAYAHRTDYRNRHHGIEHLMAAIRGRSGLFALEYDFARYSDSIRHDYLNDLLRKYFLISDQERILLTAFLKNRRARSVSDYKNGLFEIPYVGIPQGSSLSLFLANAACYEIDREIEQVGVTFARYVDDTLILCDTYEKAKTCMRLVLAHGERSGLQVNIRKSPGLSLLTRAPHAEFKCKESVVYLSHSLSPEGVQIAENAIALMKRRVAKIIYNNLLLQPKRGKVNPARLGMGWHDWDLVNCVNELRRYIYGRITERALSDALSGHGPVTTALCAMSRFPTVDGRCGSRIRSLDGWLVDTVSRAYIKRCKILKSLNLPAASIPVNEIISGSWYSFAKIQAETKLPSFYRAWQYVRKAAEIYGLERFPCCRIR